MHTHLDDRLQARAMLGNEVVNPEGPESVHHLRDALAGQPREMEAADDRVDLGHSGGLHGVAADADDAAVRAGSYDHQAASPELGHGALLAAEGVLDALAVALDLERRRADLEGLRLVHLSTKEHALGQDGRLLHPADVEIVGLELGAIEGADVHTRVVALVVARQEMIGAAIEGHRWLHAPAVGL